ncbi:U3 small nucleolar RNA-associated protein 6 homolog isoform X1 [Varroa jacobsoni]|uniref:U3 small nucleolar RNA-associated protein 6 homolog isoform X1 n=2 Tax=Varroa jacobsoni TaxID=62625 RepID=UPI000BF8D826|nr:U3 small nucleolar RNA-associated protein 6 homolog isoform X1 [Varroa jacobsoni]
MAEIALRNVEQSVEELEQLERIGLFDKLEIKTIVKRRKHFEHRLRRFVKSRADFLQYINYELSLYRLIQKRRERMKISYKKSEIDHSISRRIDLLFRKAEYKFIGDISLWFSHIEFCKLVRWKSHAAQLFTRLLQLYPNRVEAWVACAKFEFEERGEVDSARKTLQRGLRFLKDSRILWAEYFRMELAYWEKINKRQEVLELDSEEARDALFDGEILLIVFRHAIEQIPRAEFAIELLRILKSVKNSGRIYERILPIIEEQFLNSSVLWTFKATSSKTVGEAFAVFEQGLVECEENIDLWTEYIQFVLQRATVTKQPKYVQKALQLMARAGNNLPKELTLERVRLTRDVELSRMATERFYDDLEAWTIRLLLECITLAQNQNGDTAANEREDEIWSVFEMAERACLSHKDVTSLWKVILTFYKEKGQFTRLKSALERGILKPGITGIFLKEFLVDVTLSNADSTATLKLFNRLMALKPLSMTIYDRFLDTFVEDATMVRNVFEEAVREFGKNNEDLWLSYITWEQQNGFADNSGILYQRALNSLEGAHVKEFVLLYALQTQLT